MENLDAKIDALSDLIADMTLNGASKEELSRTIKYSMDIIDIEKQKKGAEHARVTNEASKLMQDFEEKVAFNEALILFEVLPQFTILWLYDKKTKETKHLIIDGRVFAPRAERLGENNGEQKLPEETSTD